MRIAAAACLVASGLMAGGIGGALAVADPAVQPADGGADSDKGSQGEPDKDGPTTGDGGDGVKNDPPGAEPGQNENDDPPAGDDEPNHEAPDGGSGDDDPDKPGEPDKPGDDPGEEPADPPVDGTGDDEQPAEPVEPTPTEEPFVAPELKVDDCDGGDDECGLPRPPWWPWPLPWDPDWDPGPGQPPGPGGGAGGGGGSGPPAQLPDVPPGMQVPPHVGVEPVDPGVLSAVPGLGVGAAALPLAPIAVPVIVAPPLSIGAGGAGAPAAPRVAPQAPRATVPDPPARTRPEPPVGVGSNTVPPAASYRAGYTDYLRSAGTKQMVALAVPGVAGMLALTAAGGLVGYRQAKAGRALRTGGTARFTN